MDIDREAILQTFQVESEEHLSTMEEALVALETHPEDEELLQTVFRMAHTIKGTAACLGLQAVVEFAHVLEHALERLRKHTLAVTSQLVTLLLRAVDVLREMVQDAVAGIEEAQPAHRAFLIQLSQGLKAGGNKLAGRLEEEAAGRVGEILSRAQEEIKASPNHSKTLRVDIEKLDRMLTLTGEITIARGRLRQTLEEPENYTLEDMLEADLDVDRLYLELQELVMKVRMVPIGPTFRRFIRAVRDEAAAHGKVARLVIEGADVEVDTTVIEHLGDPLTHMIRNALDHGIESTEVRKAKGKDPCGCITLRAFYDSGNIVIQVNDDGAGLDGKRILERARSLGAVGELEQPTEQEVFRLIFETGLSTTEALTDMSGRGIGMDVVRRNVEALNGSLEIDSLPGEGTTITMRLPLTLAIIDGFGVGVGQETYIIPLGAVTECLELPEQECRPTGVGVINLRGKPLSYLGLRDAFGLEGVAPPRQNIVVVQHGNGYAGLAVDSLYGESQFVIKSLGKLFQGLPGVSGSTILGNGRVALILDVPTLLREAVLRQNQIVGTDSGLLRGRANLNH